MDIRTSAQGFTTFLLDCASKNQSEGDVFTYELKNSGANVQISAIVLPALVRSPISAFTGPLQRPTILLTTPGQLRPETEEESPEMKGILDQFSDSVLEGVRERREEEGGREGGNSGSNSSPELVQCIQRETIFVGQQLSHKRRYLKQEVDFHPGHIRCVVTHADISNVKPFSLDVARALVSFYLVGSRMQSESLPTVWVPCGPNTDAPVIENIVGLGCEQHGSQLRIYCVREKGMNEEEGTRKKLRAGDLHGTAFARYEILSSAQDPICGQQLSVEFSWEDPDLPLAPPPALGTEAVLHVAVEPGSLQSTLTMFAEIKTLMAICESLNTGKGSLFPDESEEVVGPKETLVERVGDFFERIDTPLSHTLQVSVLSPSIETAVYKPRENLDFTEHLWLFIKDASSADDLQATLGAIFKTLLLGKVKNITLHESSNSSLAVLLRQLKLCKSVSERRLLAPKFQLILSTSKSLQFLAEIGVEKLKRDLKGFLIGAHTASESAIESFFEDQIDKGIVGQSYSLCNLYHVVELVATLLSYHCLPTPSLSSLAKVAMDYYRQRPFTGFKTTPLFSIALSRNSTVLRPIIDMCKSSTPILWSLSSKVAARVNVMSTVALTCGTSCQTGEQNFAYEASCNDV